MLGTRSSLEHDLGTQRRLGLATKNLERDKEGNAPKKREIRQKNTTKERTATDPLWSRVVRYACAELLTYDQPTVRWMELEEEGSRINSNIFNNSPHESTPLRAHMGCKLTNKLVFINRRFARFVGYQNMRGVKRMGGRTGPVQLTRALGMGCL
jgi:hypothetical protein